MLNNLIDPVLTSSEVHVWCASLRQPSGVIQQLKVTLSEEEHQRVERFHFKHLQHSFIAARGILRLILGYYVKLEPEQLQFEYTQTGKPILSRQSNTAGICFNLSHSGDLALFGVTRERQLGIDLEHIRPVDELEDIAASTFSIEENNQLKTVPPARKLEAFFNCWTRKEAFIKAIGDGISFPLDQFDVSLRPDEPARLLKIHGNEEEAARWFMQAFQPMNGYIAALVVEGNGCSVMYREWKNVEHIQNTQEPQ